jgi:hypothetical protein
MTDDRTAALIPSGIAIGMLLPLVAALAFHDVLSVFLAARTYTYVVAAVFALLVWACVTAFDVDRVDAVVWSVILPWVVAFGAIMLLLLFGQSDGLTYLFSDAGDVGRYAGAYMIAGLAAVAGSRGTERLAERIAWLPAPRTIALGVVLVAAFGVIVVAGSLHASASSATVADVQTGDTGFSGTPALNVTLDGGSEYAVLRVRSPDGDRHTTRVTGDDNGGETTTVPIEFYDLSGPVAGRYHVEVRSVLGITVDSATYTIERAPSPSIVTVETARPGESFDLDLPPGAIERRSSEGSTDSQTRVAVVLHNQGAVRAEFSTRLLVDGERVFVRDIFVDPGQQAGTIIALSDEDVERIRQVADGVVTVEVRYREDVVTRKVRLPAEDLPE